MKFENSWVIAGVRGTSIAIQWDNITIYQSQGLGGFAKYRSDTPNSQTIDLSKCSSFNVKSHNTKNLFPQNTNRYCLSGNNDTILNFTKKDLIYLNELINNNNADEKILQEKNIIAPQEIRENLTFCPITRGNNPPKTIFWPNVTNIQDMCQEKNVVAVATLTPTDGKIFYKVGNEVKEKKIDIQNTSGFYGGTLQIDAELQSILSNSKAQTPSTNIRTPVIPFLLYNKDHTYSLGCPKGTEDSEKWHCGDGWLGIIQSQEMFFGKSSAGQPIFKSNPIKIIFSK